MNKYVLATVGVLVFLVGNFLLFETFAVDPVYNFYYRRNHYQFSELKPNDPKVASIINAVNETYKRGSYTTGIRHDGELKMACLFYGSYYDVELGALFYKFANCGQSDFYLRCREIGPLFGTIMFSLKAGEEKYYKVLQPNDTSKLKHVTLKLLSSPSPLELDTNYGAGSLLMPD